MLDEKTVLIVSLRYELCCHPPKGRLVRFVDQHPQAFYWFGKLIIGREKLFNVVTHSFAVIFNADFRGWLIAIGFAFEG